MRSSLGSVPANPCSIATRAREFVFARGSHQRDDLGIGIENNKSRGLNVKDRRRAVGDRDHVDLAPLVRHTGVDQGLEKIEAEWIGLIDLLLRAAAGAYKSPTRKLIALLYRGGSSPRRIGSAESFGRCRPGPSCSDRAKAPRCRRTNVHRQHQVGASASRGPDDRRRWRR